MCVRHNRPIVNSIIIVRRIGNGLNTYNLELYIIVVDLSKVFYPIYI